MSFYIIIFKVNFYYFSQNADVPDYNDFRTMQKQTGGRIVALQNIQVGNKKHRFLKIASLQSKHCFYLILHAILTEVGHFHVFRVPEQSPGRYRLPRLQ